MTNQFRKLNQPTVLDQIWNLSRKFLYTDKKINSSVFYEFGSYLYRFKSNIDLSEGVYLKRNAILGCANPISKLTVGSNTTVGFGTIAISSSSISVELIMIAPYVHIVDSNHGSDPNINYADQENINEDIHIGNNCWIGSGAKLLAGVNLGNNCIVAAGQLLLSHLMITR